MDGVPRQPAENKTLYNSRLPVPGPPPAPTGCSRGPESDLEPPKWPGEPGLTLQVAGITGSTGSCPGHTNPVVRTVCGCAGFHPQAVASLRSQSRSSAEDSESHLLQCSPRARPRTAQPRPASLPSSVMWGPSQRPFRGLHENWVRRDGEGPHEQHPVTGHPK